MSWSHQEDLETRSPGMLTQTKPPIPPRKVRNPRQHGQEQDGAAWEGGGNLRDRGLQSATQTHAHSFPSLQGESMVQLRIKSLSQDHKKPQGTELPPRQLSLGELVSVLGTRIRLQSCREWHPTCSMPDMGLYVQLHPCKIKSRRHPSPAQ